MATLDPEHARIFRITHVENIPWILDHGLHCQSSSTTDADFVPIGLPELIAKRTSRPVPTAPGGLLCDYVPFYFTPYSVMMFNIKTGHNGVIQRPNAEIAILVSSVHRLAELQISFVFTNGHAYMQESEYYSSVDDLHKIDWKLLQAKDFKRDPEDPGKLGRYQAEALVHRHVPVEALLGIACYHQPARTRLEAEIAKRNLSLPVKIVSDWYF